MAEQPNDPRAIKFSVYVTDVCISEEVLFPPVLWASPTVESERTTDACESFHSRFNSNFSSPHTNIHLLKC